MAQRKVPPADVAPLTESGRWTADYYDLIKMLDTLDALSNIVFPTVVSSIDTATGAFTLGTGLSRTLQALSVGLSTLTNALGADVALNNVANYFDGPSVAQGSTGTWLAIGHVTVNDSTTSSARINAKLWDGTTVASSGGVTLTAGSANALQSITLVGVFVAPAGNIKISVNDSGATTGKMLFNASGNSKDCNLTVIRIA